VSQPHVAPNGHISKALAAGGSLNYQQCTNCGARIHTIDYANGIGPLDPGTLVGDDCPGPSPHRQTGDSMAKRAKAPTTGDGESTEKPARGPRSRTLPGLEETRLSSLDNICESIAESRSQMNKLRQEEQDDMNSALKLLRKHQRTSYRHNGVELARVPGEEKLRVRYREGATAETEDGDSAEA